MSACFSLSAGSRAPRGVFAALRRPPSLWINCGHKRNDRQECTLDLAKTMRWKVDGWAGVSGHVFM